MEGEDYLSRKINWLYYSIFDKSCSVARLTQVKGSSKESKPLPSLCREASVYSSRI